MRRNKLLSQSTKGLAWRPRATVALAFPLLVGLAATSLLLKAGDNSSDGVPSYVSWTADTIAAASRGDAFRGMLLARRCDHCHGAEGFSSVASTPNLAGMDRLVIWKELQDFRAHKRRSRAMEPIAESLSALDTADVAAYYSKLPVFSDPQDNRVFPQSRPDPRFQRKTYSRNGFS